MFDDPKFGNLFPTRTGTASGTANERQMLDTIGGAEGYRTRMMNSADGSVTMLRTRNGMPEFSRVGSQSAGRPTLWRGLSAYPECFSDVGNYTWSLPVVFNAPDGYQIAARNPVQLASLSYLYWVGDKGNVCGSGGGKAYFTLESKNNQYTKFSIATIPQSLLSGNGDIPVAKYGPIPFVSTPSNLFSFATSNVLENISGSALFKLAPLTVNFDPTKGATYADQLPQVISKDGTDVVLLAKDDKYFQEFVSSSYTTNEKCYWYLRLQMNGSAWSVSCDETLVKVAAAEYSIGNPTSGGNEPVTDDIEKMTWQLIISNGSSPVPQKLNTYPGYDVYDVGKLENCVDDVRNDQTIQYQRRDYNDWPLSIVKDDISVVSFINGATSLVPVTVRVKSGYNRHTFCEGQTYIANRDPSVYMAQYGFATWQSRAENRALSSNYVRKKVVTSDSNDSYVSVSFGPSSIRVFEVSASCSGNALLKHRVNTNRADAHYWEPGQDNLRLSPSVVTIASPRPGPGYDWDTPGIYDPYPNALRGAYMSPYLAPSGPWTRYVPETGWDAEAARLLAQPLVRDVYDFSTDPTESHEETDYTTDLSMTTSSRFIVGCDLSIGVLAYVEMSISYSATVVGPAAGYWIYAKNKLFPHTVTSKFVIEYQGTKFERELFNVIVNKPLYLMEEEQVNWYLWPVPGNQYDPGMTICANPIIIPTPTTFTGIDGVFQHQGVCPDFAGFTTKEIADPSSAGYTEGGDIKRLIYAKRFKLTDDKMHWLLSYLKIDEAKRGANDQSPPGDLLSYYYCPELKKKLDVTYQIEFDQNGFVDWIDNIPDPSATPPNRDASCWRI